MGGYGGERSWRRSRGVGSGNEVGGGGYGGERSWGE